MGTKTKIAAAGMLATAALTGLAPPAHADEQSYLNNIYASGYWGTPQTWLTIGYTVCAMVHNGANQGAVASYVYYHTANDTDWASADRAVELAEIYLC